jgi:hypothetical protein
MVKTRQINTAVKASRKIKLKVQITNPIIEKALFCLFLKMWAIFLYGKLCHAKTISIEPALCKGSLEKISGKKTIVTTEIRATTQPLTDVKAFVGYAVTGKV